MRRFAWCNVRPTPRLACMFMLVRCGIARTGGGASRGIASLLCLGVLSSWSRRWRNGWRVCRPLSSPTRRSTSTCSLKQGPLLGEPYTKQLDRKLRELRFHLERRSDLLDRDP
jgi:hypothetical protein